GMWFFRGAEALQRHDLLLLYSADRHHAGAHCLAADHDSARSALRHAAAKLGSSQVQVVAEHVQQRGFRIGVDAVNLTVYLQRNGSHHPTTPEISDDKIVQQVPLLGVSTPRRSLAPRSDFAERPKKSCIFREQPASYLPFVQ